MLSLAMNKSEKLKVKSLALPCLKSNEAFKSMFVFCTRFVPCQNVTDLIDREFNHYPKPPMNSDN